MMRIYIDFKSPAALLAMEPTLALSEKLGLRFEYLPFRTSQFPIPEEKPEETRGETHRRVRAIARRNTYQKYAAIQGTDLKFPNEPGETDLALAALLYVQPSPDKFIKAAFSAYWSEGQDLNDRDLVHRLLSAEGFGADKYLGELEQIYQEAEEIGIIDAPTYVVDGQIFLGREHLPWIETLLVPAN